MRLLDCPVIDRAATAGRATRALLFALAVLAVVGAQTIGLVHRIAHGDTPRLGPAPAWQLHHDAARGGHPHEAPAGHHAGAPAHPGHDCAAIDALTTGVALLAAVPMAAVIAPPADKSVTVAQLEPRRRGARAFDARGPPAFS